MILHQAMYQSIKKHFKLSNYLIQDFQVQKEKYSCFRKCDDEKNLPPRRPQFFIFFNRFCGDILFYYLVCFAFFVFLYFCLFVGLFFEIKNIYSDTHSTMRAGEWKYFFRPADFRKEGYLFLVQIFKSSRPEVFLGNGILKICSKFTR